MGPGQVLKVFVNLLLGQWSCQGNFTLRLGVEDDGRVIKVVVTEGEMRICLTAGGAQVWVGAGQSYGVAVAES